MKNNFVYIQYPISSVQPLNKRKQCKEPNELTPAAAAERCLSAAPTSRLSSLQSTLMPSFNRRIFHHWKKSPTKIFSNTAYIFISYAPQFCVCAYIYWNITCSVAKGIRPKLDGIKMNGCNPLQSSRMAHVVCHSLSNVITHHNIHQQPPVHDSLWESTLLCISFN